MSEHKRWSPADVRDEYFTLYGPGEITTLRILMAGRGRYEQAELALRELARRDPRVRIQEPLVNGGVAYFAIERC